MPTKIVLPLDEMTVAEKLELVYAIWDDLLLNPEDVPIPDWHEEYLKRVQKEIDEGKAEFIAFETAKKRLYKMTSKSPRRRSRGRD